MTENDYIQKFRKRGFHYNDIKKGLKLFGSRLTESDLMNITEVIRDDRPIPSRGAGISKRSSACKSSKY